MAPKSQNRTEIRLQELQVISAILALLLHQLEQPKSTTGVSESMTHGKPGDFHLLFDIQPISF